MRRAKQHSREILRRLTMRPHCGTPEQRQRRQGIFLGKGGPLTTIADTTGQFASVSDPSLKIFGHVAFQAERFDALGQQIFSSRTSRGGLVTTVTESNPDPLAKGPVYASFRGAVPE